MDNSITDNNKQHFNYSTKSMIDGFGRVFFHENSVFREISDEATCNKLLNSELFKELFKEELVPQSIITNKFSSFSNSLIIEHEKITESLQHEWSFQMFKEAALVVLKVNKICNKYNYELKDAHTLNILFKGIKPVCIDIGSISHRKHTESWVAYNEFLNSMFIPLLFWSNNKYYIVRKLLESNFYAMLTIPSQSIEDSNLLSLIEHENLFYKLKINSRTIYKTRKHYRIMSLIKASINFILRRVLRIDKYLAKYGLEENLYDIFKYNDIENIINNLKLPELNSTWSGYHNKFYNNFENIEIPNRFRKLIEIIANYNDINTVIDLAGNEGYFSYLISKNNNINKIILADYDENAIDKAFQNFRQNNITKITPLLLNFMFTPDIEGTAKRLKSDLAVALAITHHLILSQCFSLASILERIASYSNKYVMVEFMPLGLWSIEHKELKTIPAWYNVDWFRSAFKSIFKLLIEEQLEENRIVFFGELK